MINKVILIGRMTKDPVLKMTNSRKCVASFSLAIKRMFSSVTGQDVDYVNCEIWGKGAENTEKYCSKGSMVAITGALQSRSYENSQRQRVNQIIVVCDSIEFIETKKKEHKQDSSFEIDKDTSDIIEISPDDIQF